MIKRSVSIGKKGIGLVGPIVANALIDQILDIKKIAFSSKIKLFTAYQWNC